MGPTEIAGVPAFANPGEMITARLTPPLEASIITVIQQHPINLDLIAKQVVFANTDFGSPGGPARPDWIASPAVANTLPYFNLAAAVPTVAGGVPGLLGKLTGTIPVATTTSALPTLEVTWTVTDDMGATLANGRDFLAPNGLNRATLDIVFLPAFVDFQGMVPAPVGRNLNATVTVTSGTTPVTGTLTVRVEVPATPLPRVLALTVDADFQGPALVLVPGNSRVTSLEHLKPVLELIRTAIAPFSGVAHLVELLTGINTLTGILNATHIKFSKQDEVRELDSFVYAAGFLGFGRLTAEDSMSSFVYLSPPPPPVMAPNPPSEVNTASLFISRNLSTSEGRLRVSTGPQFVALCPSLHMAHPAVSPSGATTDPNPPAGGHNWAQARGFSTFGDELSSVAFH